MRKDKQHISPKHFTFNLKLNVIALKKCEFQLWIKKICYCCCCCLPLLRDSVEVRLLSSVFEFTIYTLGRRQRFSLCIIVFIYSLYYLFFLYLLLIVLIVQSFHGHCCRILHIIWFLCLTTTATTGSSSFVCVCICVHELFFFIDNNHMLNTLTFDIL